MKQICNRDQSILSFLYSDVVITSCFIFVIPLGSQIPRDTWVVYKTGQSNRMENPVSDGRGV
jgi:hypothetical protein